MLACALLSIECSAANTGSDLLAVPTQTKITKTRGGIRGFKTVTEDIRPGGYANLACANPGHQKCVFKNPPQLATSDLTQVDLENIDTTINTTVGNGDFTGSFTFTSAATHKYLVIFEADPEQGKIDYVIYTQIEAAEQGYEI
jgi:hypothetical protein